MARQADGGAEMSNENPEIEKLLEMEVVINVPALVVGYEQHTDDDGEVITTFDLVLKVPGSDPNSPIVLHNVGSERIISHRLKHEYPGPPPPLFGKDAPEEAQE